MVNFFSIKRVSFKNYKLNRVLYIDIYSYKVQLNCLYRPKKHPKNLY